MITADYIKIGHMNGAFISEQGIRPEMEDAHFLDFDFGKKGWVYGGIYDGHGGKYAARFAAEHLPKLFLDKYLELKIPGQAFTEAYEGISNAINNQDSGAAAVDFFIANGSIYTANAGDARIIIVSKGEVIQLTTDHRLDNKEEAQRIIEMGGGIRYPYTMRGISGIMPTRSIGDEYFKPVGIISTPSVNEYLIKPDDIMLLAGCDGLFDFISNEEIAKFARQIREPEILLNHLRKEVLVTRGGTDNLTVIAVTLN